MPNIGDRVLAEWPAEKEWWYPGVVCGTNAAGFEIQFDDGDRATLGESQITSLELEPGARVQCRFKGGHGFYPGQVASAQGAAIQVNYDDGDREATSISMVRVNARDLS